MARPSQNRNSTFIGCRTRWRCSGLDIHSQPLVSRLKSSFTGRNRARCCSCFSFGAKVRGMKTGIIYNDQMDDFSTPNTTNYFGVPASPANFIVPSKRPVSSMAPLIVVERQTQRVQLVSGASGGTRITTSIAQTAMLNLLFGQDIKKAIDAPRLHSQLLPQEVAAESGFDVVSKHPMNARVMMCHLSSRTFCDALENVVTISLCYFWWIRYPRH
jgi:hypothetical protein